MGVYDVVNDCMLQSGKNSFQQDISDGLGGYINFTYYDFASSSALTSDLRISNYISDITAEVGAPSPSGAEQTWYASLDTDMERDPTRVYWKVRGQYDGGTVTRTRPATAVEFAARETTASWPLVKTATAANARADRYLLDISTEEDVITTTIWVHPDHVNDARAGRRIQARFSHLPGYEDWVWMRILNRTVTFETPEVYRIQYTLSATPAFPHSCALQVPGLVNTLYEVGPNSGGPDGISSISVTTIPAPSSFPAVVISGFGGGTGYTGSGDATLSGAFSSLWTDYPTSPLVSVGGYQALGSGAPGAFDVSFGRVDGYCVISIYLLTAATAPVQTAVQDLTGGTATFGATPTVGNILIAYAFDSLNTGGPGRDMTGDGWTLVKMEDGPLHLGFPTGGIQSLALSAWARCVAEGDTDTYDVGGGAFAHWTFLSEWELT
jgi:hypothetical protein